MKSSPKRISIVIPCYNEAPNINSSYKALVQVIKNDPRHTYGLLYVNDGSRDNTLRLLHKLAREDTSVQVLSLSKNFGKEIALAAGLQYAQGDAIIMVDADGQHPAELIPQFIEKWEQGAQVVTGIRKSNQQEGWVKKYGSKLFYRAFNSLTGTELIPGSSDFRLIDKTVQSEFVRMTERNRITRGLIDWLGFNQEYIDFHANARTAGEAGYSFSKLFSLALSSFVSLSPKPLYFSFYLGLIVLPVAIVLGLFSVIEMLVGDPLGLNITGTAYLVILALFLIGTLLISQGITALYLSHIHAETQNRPLFVIDSASSRSLLRHDS